MKQSREENNNNGKKADKMHVKEWLHQNAKRPVKAKFGPDETIYLLNRKGDKLRTISIKSVESLVVEITQDTNKKPMVLIRVLKDHDLVLEFSYVAERKKFLAKLENFLQGNYSVGWSSRVKQEMLLSSRKYFHFTEKKYRIFDTFSILQKVSHFD